jgi:hypothetical protein
MAMVPGSFARLGRHWLSVPAVSALTVSRIYSARIMGPPSGGLFVLQFNLVRADERGQTIQFGNRRVFFQIWVVQIASAAASPDRPKSRMVAQDFCISEEPADKVGERGLRFCYRRLTPVQAGEDAVRGEFFQQLFSLRESRWFFHGESTACQRTLTQSRMASLQRLRRLILAWSHSSWWRSCSPPCHDRPKVVAEFDFFGAKCVCAAVEMNFIPRSQSTARTDFAALAPKTRNGDQPK